MLLNVNGLQSKQHLYVPTLRAKTGEATALSRLPPADKDFVSPIIQIPPSHAAGFANAFGAAWAGRPAALDGSDETSRVGTTNTFDAMFAALVSQGILLLPVISQNCSPIYLSSALALASSFGRGLVVRCRIADLTNIVNWISRLGIAPANVDLVIDIGHVADADPYVMSRGTQSLLASNPSLLSGWRSTTLSASAGLKDVSSLTVGANLVPRNDWLIWKICAAAVSNLHFGDYGVSHRSLAEPPGAAMATATVSVKYTGPDQWLVLKGTRTSGPNGRPMSAQYIGHTQAIVQHAFYQHGLSWADGQIHAIATGAASSAGSRATWVGYSLNRHLAVTISQL